jgi:hypothetical protein
MNDKANQLDQADAAIEKEAAAFMIQIESMLGEWEPVASTYIVEGVLLKLCDRMTKLLDDPSFAEHMGPATMKLSDAMADYRDSRYVDRG